MDKWQREGLFANFHHTTREGLLRASPVMVADLHIRLPANINQRKMAEFCSKFTENLHSCANYGDEERKQLCSSINCEQNFVGLCSLIPKMQVSSRA